MMAHEGGYNEVYVPFCGHAVLEVMSDASAHAPDPLAETLAARQPSEQMQAVFSEYVGSLEELFRKPAAP